MVNEERRFGMGRSIAAVVAGYAIWTVVWLVGGFGIMKAFADRFMNDRTEDPGVLLVILGNAVVCSLAAGMTSKMIQNRKGSRAHIVLAALLLLTGIGVQAAAWDSAPAWYHIVFLISIVPITLAGAAMLKSNKANPVPSAA